MADTILSRAIALAPAQIDSKNNSCTCVRLGKLELACHSAILSVRSLQQLIVIVRAAVTWIFRPETLCAFKRDNIVGLRDAGAVGVIFH